MLSAHNENIVLPRSVEIRWYLVGERGVGVAGDGGKAEGEGEGDPLVADGEVLAFEVFLALDIVLEKCLNCDL